MDEIDGKVALTLINADGSKTKWGCVEWRRASESTRNYFLVQARAARLATLSGYYNEISAATYHMLLGEWLTAEIARLESEDRTQSTDGDGVK